MCRPASGSWNGSARTWTMPWRPWHRHPFAPCAWPTWRLKRRVPPPLNFRFRLWPRAPCRALKDRACRAAPGAFGGSCQPEPCATCLVDLASAVAQGTSIRHALAFTVVDKCTVALSTAFRLCPKCAVAQLTEPCLSLACNTARFCFGMQPGKRFPRVFFEEAASMPALMAVAIAGAIAGTLCMARPLSPCRL